MLWHYRVFFSFWIDFILFFFDYMAKNIYLCGRKIKYKLKFIYYEENLLFLYIACLFSNVVC